MIMLKPVEDEDPEDILADSLDTLYDCQPVSLSSPGRHFVLQLNHRNHTLSIEPRKPISISCRVPYRAYPRATSRGLSFASDVADKSDQRPRARRRCRDPSSDYPDDQLIAALEDNVQTNDVASRCKVVPYAWGSDASPLLPRSETTVDCGFDVIIAADTLWNSDTHAIFVETLRKTLKKDAKSRIHLVAGLHTGRFTIQSMLDRLKSSGFDVDSAEERQVHGDQRRGWIVERDGEDEFDRRRWLVWIKVKWHTT